MTYGIVGIPPRVVTVAEAGSPHPLDISPRFLRIIRTSMRNPSRSSAVTSASLLGLVLAILVLSLHIGVHAT